MISIKNYLLNANGQIFLCHLKMMYPLLNDLWSFLQHDITYFSFFFLMAILFNSLLIRILFWCSAECIIIPFLLCTFLSYCLAMPPLSHFKLMNNILSSIARILIFILLNKVVYFTVLDYLSSFLMSNFYQLHKILWIEQISLFF